MTSWSNVAGNSNITTITNTTLTSSQSTVLANPGTITLPLISSVPAGIEYTIKKIDSSFSTVTVAGNGSTIDGANSYVLYLKNEGIRIKSNGSAWFVVGEIASDVVDYFPYSTFVGLRSTWWSKVLTVQKTGKRVHVNYGIWAYGDGSTYVNFTLPVPVKSGMNYSALSTFAGADYGNRLPESPFCYIEDVQPYKLRFNTFYTAFENGWSTTMNQRGVTGQIDYYTD